MQTVSALYNTIIAQTNHWFETKVTINGVTYGEDKLMSVTATNRIFASEQPTVGGCLSGELEVKMLAPTVAIPRMAEVRPYVRVLSEEYPDADTWIPQGVYFIDTRETTHNDNGLDILKIHCYDAMLKAEADYPSTSHTWPYSDKNVVKEIAWAMGLQANASYTSGIDSRTLTLMNKNYQIYAPIGYSMREVLGNIAAMYAGNWIMNYEGKLRLITLTELPSETNYLVDNAYEAITFGGDRILV